MLSSASYNCSYYDNGHCKVLNKKCAQMLYLDCVNRIRADNKALKNLLEEAAEMLNNTACHNPLADELVRRIEEAL